jgi:hypothetical protein
MESGAEILKFLSRKSLDLAIRSDSFASEPNKKISEPIRWRGTSRQYGPKPRGVIRGVEHEAVVRAEHSAHSPHNRVTKPVAVALESGQELAALGLMQKLSSKVQHARDTRACWP